MSTSEASFALTAERTVAFPFLTPVIRCNLESRISVKRMISVLRCGNCLFQCCGRLLSRGTYGKRVIAFLQRGYRTFEIGPHKVCWLGRVGNSRRSSVALYSLSEILPFDLQRRSRLIRSTKILAGNNNSRRNVPPLVHGTDSHFFELHFADVDCIIRRSLFPK